MARRDSKSSMSMDASHGPHSHGRNAGQTTLRLQTEESYESSPAGAAAPQTIEFPETSAEGVATPSVSTPGYEYQPTPPSPSATKRASAVIEPPTSTDNLYPVLKRIRTEGAPSSDAGSDSSCCPSPTPSASETVATEPTLERSTSHRFKPAGTNKLYRSQSLPAKLRSKRRLAENPQQHLPPVTLSTLRELDLHEIYRNPKLRHDVVFDSQLHFRPNLDGSRGRRKKEQADIYWKLVLHECEMLFQHVRNRQPGAAEMALKLPLLFRTMRDILLTLVPKNDRVEVEAALDPPLLMQQLEHGVLDFKMLAEWLASVLKAHCAPMRDSWVDQMVQRVAYGVDNAKTSALVDGIKMVFGILESMKLDVANHQIRTLRPHLVSTAITFEQTYFSERIQNGRLDMTAPRQWCRSALDKFPSSDPGISFTNGVIDMLTPSRSSEYPATFTFDVERLEGLRDDIREATYLKISILFFRQLTLSSRRDLDAATIDRLRLQILAILGEEEGVYRWIRNSDAVALHLAQAASEFNGYTGMADASLVKLSEGWLARHLQVDSPIYARVEQCTLGDLSAMVQQIMKGWATLSSFPIMQIADVTGSSFELASISQTVAHIAFMHWRIFGKMYLED